MVLQLHFYKPWAENYRINYYAMLTSKVIYAWQATILFMSIVCGSFHGWGWQNASKSLIWDENLVCLSYSLHIY